MKPRKQTIYISVFSAVAAALVTVALLINSISEFPHILPNSDITSSISSSLTSEDPSSSTETQSEAVSSAESLPAVVIDPGPPLVVSSPAESVLTLTESTFTFTGSSDPEKPLLVNGNEIPREENGIFSYTVSLNNGKNTFVFKHKDQSKAYTLNYRYVVIESYSPKAPQTFSSGSEFAVSVKARKGSTVTAKLYGELKTLEPQPSADTDTFINYTGKFGTPTANIRDVDLGPITFSATHNGITETFRSNNIICLKPEIIVDFDPNATPVGGKYVNVGSGKIAEIVDYQAETFDAKSTDNYSRPTNNYLPKGTMDYSSQEYYYHNEETQFTLLRCGYQVYSHRKDKPGNKYVQVVKEYKGTLPDHNEVGIDSFTNNGRHTVLTMNVNWKAPFYFDILPQQYLNPVYQDYRIDAVTYNYIDITFCYATVFNGELPDLTDNPIFKSGQIIKNQSDYTLRLYLKKQGGFYGWDSYYNEQGQLVFEFLNPAKTTVAENPFGTALNGVVILLDVGHGGIDIGAEGFDYINHSEAIQNLTLAQKVKAELESIGATVYMTRTENVTSTTDDKITMLKRIKPDFCLAIHHNSHNSPSPNGFDAMYYYAFSQRATQFIKNHTANTAIYKECDVGWHYYFTCRTSNCPVVLTENGYISNSYDYKNIIDSQANVNKAVALTKGIVEYFNSIQ